MGNRGKGSPWCGSLQLVTEVDQAKCMERASKVGWYLVILALVGVCSLGLTPARWACGTSRGETLLIVSCLEGHLVLSTQEVGVFT